jgi:hypothetical protein
MSGTKAMMEVIKSVRVDPLARLISPDWFWKEKWQYWCESNHFGHLGDYDVGYALIGERLSDELCGSPAHSRLAGRRERKRTLREDVLAIGDVLANDSEVTELLVNFRHHGRG